MGAESLGEERRLHCFRAHREQEEMVEAERYPLRTWSTGSGSDGQEMFFTDGSSQLGSIEVILQSPKKLLYSILSGSMQRLASDGDEDSLWLSKIRLRLRWLQPWRCIHHPLASFLWLPVNVPLAIAAQVLTSSARAKAAVRPARRCFMPSPRHRNK